MACESTTSRPATETVTVDMARDALVATLRIDDSTDASEVTAETCLAALREAGVKLNDAITRDVGAHIKRWQAGEGRDQPLVLRGTPPVHGEAGRVVWQPQCDPATLGLREEGAEDKIDFYDTRHFINVEKGQVVAHVVAPSPGTAGENLRGEPIPPTPGKPQVLRFDPNGFGIDEAGECTCLLAGVLRVNKEEVSISPILQVADNVDFSTGNIDFGGDVTIGGGVCDRFCVRAGGNVEVNGTIEAATIETGGDLLAKSGLATRGQGRIQVGRDLKAKYLNATVVDVSRDLHVEREIMGSRVVVGRNLDVPRGAVLGGITIVCGAAHVQTLGSDGELLTKLVLGHSPKLEKMIRAVHQRLGVIEGQLADPLTGRSDLESMRAEMKDRLAQLNHIYKRSRTVDLRVDKTLYGGVILVVDGRQFFFRTALKGPSIIRWNSRREVTYEAAGGSKWPLAEVPGVATHEL